MRRPDDLSKMLSMELMELATDTEPTQMDKDEETQRPEQHAVRTPHVSPMATSTEAATDTEPKPHLTTSAIVKVSGPDGKWFPAMLKRKHTCVGYTRYYYVEYSATKKSDSISEMLICPPAPPLPQAENFNSVLELRQDVDAFHTESRMGERAWVPPADFQGVEFEGAKTTDFLITVENISDPKVKGKKEKAKMKKKANDRDTNLAKKMRSKRLEKMQGGEVEVAETSGLPTEGKTKKEKTKKKRAKDRDTNPAKKIRREGLEKTLGGEVEAAKTSALPSEWKSKKEKPRKKRANDPVFKEENTRLKLGLCENG
ncbi:unnamed protein product [Thlaspi arvense]|uniref:Tudor domain-containing protein n=1 Tax=Thlaspi arvense TaxID=13288 RepID=A0AAU9SQR9_THLAR|nr:unnamed protein product [Thlaspi arvense]